MNIGNCPFTVVAENKSVRGEGLICLDGRRANGEKRRDNGQGAWILMPEAGGRRSIVNLEPCSRKSVTGTGRMITLRQTVMIVLMLGFGLSSAFAQTIGDYRSNAADMNWSSATDWQTFNGGWVTATTYPGENAGTGLVTIQDGQTVTINVSPLNPISSLLVGEGSSGILQYEATTARTLMVSDIVRINLGGIFRSALTGTVTSHQLFVDRGIVNNGTINFSTNTAGAGITFSGGSNGLFDLSAATLTNLRASNGLVLNKGSNVLSFTPGGTFQVLSGNAVGFLTLQSGTLSLMGENAFSNPLFYATTGNYTIPVSGGFRLDNPNATIVGMYGTLTNAGEVIVRDGIYNIGTGSGNESLTTSTGSFEMSGGTMNISGRFRIDDGDCILTGGIMNLATIGHANSSLAAFHISPSANLTISGDPLVTFAFPNTAGTPFNDLEIEAGTGIKSIAGGTFQMGTSVTSATRTFLVNSDIPIHNLMIYNAHARVSLTDHLTVNNQLILNGRLLMNNYNLDIGAPAITGIFGANAGMIVTPFGTGEFRKTINTGGSYLFPLGDGSGSTPYLPITLNFTSGTFTPGATVAVCMIRYKHPHNLNTNNYLKRYWTVRTTGITNPVYNFTGKYASADIVGDYNYINTGVYTNVWKILNPNSSFTITATGLMENVDISGINVAAPTVKITTLPPYSICPGSSITLTSVASGDLPISYLWTPASGLSSTTISNPVANPTVTTPYIVTVTDGNGIKASAVITIEVNPNVATPVFTLGATTVCQNGPNVTYKATAANNTGITYTLSPPSAGVMDLNAGVMDWDTNFKGIATITAIANGCNGPVSTAQNITVTPTVGTPVFGLGATSNRCQDSGTVIYAATATNSTNISYNLDPSTGAFAGNSIVVATGEVTYAETWSGTTTIIATAADCNGPKSTNHVVTINPLPAPSLIHHN